MKDHEISCMALSPLEAYYRFHARIYDLTRWSFLFKRAALIQILARSNHPDNILEVGCGTGNNLIKLRKRFYTARITGLDLSQAMLNQASKRLARVSSPVSLRHGAYHRPLKPKRPFDLILFSYALSMFNPGWEEALDFAKEDLAEDGKIAVVDFHHSNWRLFRNWMGLNHVKMERHLLPKLSQSFTPQYSKTHEAYLGLWSYFLFIGTKRT